jgi:hypothetical protein
LHLRERGSGFGAIIDTTLINCTISCRVESSADHTQLMERSGAPLRVRLQQIFTIIPIRRAVEAQFVFSKVTYPNLLSASTGQTSARAAV